MTREQKKLLLKDLCARLPYGVKIQWDKFVETLAEITDWKVDSRINSHKFEEIKPYLRPMSSMTEEEIIQYNKLCFWTLPYPIIAEECIAELNDWLNAHHFDFRGLIPKGLALEAPEDMYKTE